MPTPCGVDWMMAKESVSVDFGNYLLDAVHYLLLRKRSRDIFVKRFFLWPSNQLYRSSKSPPDVRGRCGALLGRAGLPCCENMGFNNISPGTLLLFLQNILLRHHENS